MVDSHTKLIAHSEQKKYNKTKQNKIKTNINILYNKPAKFGPMSTTLAMAPAYEAVINVTAVNHVMRTIPMLQPRYPIASTIRPGITCAAKHIHIG